MNYFTKPFSKYINRPIIQIWFANMEFVIGNAIAMKIHFGEHF